MELPGFFRVILASLAHIPRNEPIGDDLMELERNNRRSRWLSQLIDSASPMVDQAVSGLLPKAAPGDHGPPVEMPEGRPRWRRSSRRALRF